MARSTGSYFEGTLSSVVSGQKLNIYNTIVSRLQSFLTNGVTAWETYDPITGGGTPDTIFRSLGNRAADPTTGAAAGVGDANLFLRLNYDGTNLNFNAYQDWTTNGVGSGIRPAVGGSGTALGVDDTAAVEYFGVVNEYEFVFIFVQTGVWYFLWFGSPRRLHVPTRASGIARATANVLAGGPVSIAVDRDLATPNLLQVGQRVWVYDVMTSGAAFPGGHNNAELATVTAVGTSSITVATLANNHGSGANSKAIIGLDPCPMIIGAAISGSSPNFAATNRINSASPGGGSQTHNWYPTIPIASTASFIGGNDPADTNLFVGVAGSFYDTTLNGFRGASQHVHFWPVSTQANKDRMIPNFDSTLAEKIFPSLQYGGTNLVPAIGPGATP